MVPNPNHYPLQSGLPQRLPRTRLLVVLGDSTLSRIPDHGYPSVQVESFPGAQIHHLKGILAKPDACTATQKVVLSVGLNNCLRENLLETIKKQLQQLVAVTRKTFPNADIYVPLIHCSDKLSYKTQQLAKQTNIFLVQQFTTLKMVQNQFFLRCTTDILSIGPQKRLLTFLNIG